MATQKMKDKLAEAIQHIKEKKQESEEFIVRINTHYNPDPDAIGAAMGLQVLLKDEGIESKIYYSGEISHPQNKTIVNVLGVTLEKRNGKPLPDGVDACVDCTESNSKAENPVLVIDHHKSSTKAKYNFTDTSYGSCSALVWKMMKEDNHEPTQENSAVYTALLLGIRTDTNDLVSENISKDDFIGYQELLEHSDKESLQKVMNYPFPRYLYDNRLNVHKEGNSIEKDGVFIGGVGYISGSQRDVISILSEEYARMESVTTSVIFAIVDKKELHVSVRSTLVSVDVSQMMKDLFGEYGGGKSNAGAARIPLAFYDDMVGEEAEKLWKLTCNQMFKKILKEQFEDKNG
jgi:nanoRNase/pAp phosphatase (c-di-AMP/oligoRNAs hydrolase)